MPETAEANVYEVVVQGICQVVQTINRYFYASPTAMVDVDNFVDAFNTAVLQPMIPVINGSTTFNLVSVQQVKGGTQFGSKSILVAGSVSGDGLPPFVSWDFTLLRDGAFERNGYKRIAGLAESQQANGAATPTAAALLDLVAAGMASQITADAVIFTPVVKRTKIHRIPQIPPKYFTISDVRYSKIGSQNSRKFGHGR